MCGGRLSLDLKPKRGTRFLNNAPQNMQSQNFCTPNFDMSDPIWVILSEAKDLTIAVVRHANDNVCNLFSRGPSLALGMTAMKNFHPFRRKVAKNFSRLY